LTDNRRVTASESLLVIGTLFIVMGVAGITSTLADVVLARVFDGRAR